MQVYRVNTVGPYLVTKYFLPQLRKKSTKVVINTSSIVGSIAFNASGGYKGLWLPYTSSKAALNMRKLLVHSCHAAAPLVFGEQTRFVYVSSGVQL